MTDTSEENQSKDRGGNANENGALYTWSDITTPEHIRCYSNVTARQDHIQNLNVDK